MSGESYAEATGIVPAVSASVFWVSSIFCVFSELKNERRKTFGFISEPDTQDSGSIITRDTLHNSSQLSNEFLGRINGGIWGDLEGWVRGRAKELDPKKDTMYVVTGCVQEGSTTWTDNTYQAAVKVPAAYFKACLRKSGTNYTAIALFLPQTKEAYDKGGMVARKAALPKAMPEPKQIEATVVDNGNGDVIPF